MFGRLGVEAHSPTRRADHAVADRPQYGLAAALREAHEPIPGLERKIDTVARLKIHIAAVKDRKGSLSPQESLGKLQGTGLHLVDIAAGETFRGHQRPVQLDQELDFVSVPIS